MYVVYLCKSVYRYNRICILYCTKIQFDSKRLHSREPFLTTTTYTIVLQLRSDGPGGHALTTGCTHERNASSVRRWQTSAAAVPWPVFDWAPRQRRRRPTAAERIFSPHKLIPVTFYFYFYLNTSRVISTTLVRGFFTNGIFSFVVFGYNIINYLGKACFRHVPFYWSSPFLNFEILTVRTFKFVGIFLALLPPQDRKNLGKM